MKKNKEEQLFGGVSDTLVGAKIKRLSDGKMVTIKSERIIDDLFIYSDTEGNIYNEDELDIRYKVAAEYLLYKALKDNDIIGSLAWTKHRKNLELALRDFMQAMVKSGYIIDKEGVK